MKLTIRLEIEGQIASGKSKIASHIIANIHPEYEIIKAEQYPKQHTDSESWYIELQRKPDALPR